jgi:hypothetical protein
MFVNSTNDNRKLVRETVSTNKLLRCTTSCIPKQRFVFKLFLNTQCAGIGLALELQLGRPMATHTCSHACRCTDTHIHVHILIHIFNVDGPVCQQEW